jgi:nucleoside-diphosphate-sugar epimerase
VSGNVYNIACGERVTLNRLVNELGELLGTSVEPEYAPPRPADIRHSLADVSRARRDLGYEPTVRLREGLERTIQHFRAEELPTDLERIVAAHER